MDLPLLIQLEQIGSPETGYLTVAQYGEYLPFEIKRVFWNYAVPNGTERGNHAYRRTRQLLVVLNGKARVTLESPDGQQSVHALSLPHEGLYVPALYWRRVEFFEGAILAVFSSHAFDPADSLRDYEAFRAMG
ncbi:MAG: FdtA/QdtA family cupin domain-containing protein [Ferruginibacter sp.]|nr:FdtA/QdtA family cupin domain-containing protein [Cytophagales bacterium]